MAWTAPRTWVTSEVVTASLLNTHVRDNLLQTAPAKASAGGGYIIGTGVGVVAERQLANAEVTTGEGTASSTFTNLATSGPAVTVTTGTVALVVVSARVTGSAIGVRPVMGWAVTGATSLSAAEQYCFEAEISVSGDFYQASHMSTRTLTGGSNTFTAKYADIGGTGTATFQWRKIQVLPGN